MLFYQRIFLTFLLFIAPVLLFAQDDSPAANYKAALALVNANKGADAIPLLEKVIKTPSPNTAAAYGLLGSIYDDSHQPEKAIAVYKDGLKAYPTEQSLFYNLGLAYSRNKQYADAETAAIEAIKLDPQNANSQRMYALVTFHQNKQVQALLGFCSFILLEPNTARSTEAFGNIQHILQGGVLKGDDGKPLILTAADDKNLAAGLSAVLAEAKAKKLAGADMLQYQLKSIFIMTGQLADKKTDKTFFDNFYAAYFYKLAQSDTNLSAFAELLTTQQIGSSLSDWMRDTSREF